MPLNATEIEGLTEFIADQVNAMASPDPDASTLVKRSEAGDARFRGVKAEVYAIGDNFAGNTLSPISAETSNDPDDLLAKLNEVITAVNLARQG